MKLDDMLAGVGRRGLDTPPLIYFIDRNPAYLNLVCEVFRRITAGLPTAHSSVILLTEVLTNRIASGRMRLHAATSAFCSANDTSRSM